MANPTATTSSDNRAWFRAGIALAIMFGVLTAGFAGWFTWQHFQPMVPLESAKLDALKAEYIKNHGAMETREQIRLLDSQMRKADMRRRFVGENGSYILVAGAVMFILSLTVAMSKTSRQPVPPATAEGGAPPRESRSASRWAVAAMAAIIAGVAAIVAMRPAPARPWLEALAVAENPQHPATAIATADTSNKPAPPTVATTFPAAKQLAENWPRFRGHEGAGVCRFTDMPTQWDAAAGKGVKWKTAIPFSGHSSPVVWGNRVFLTSGQIDEKAGTCERMVLCLDADKGDILWSKIVAGPGQFNKDEVNESAGLAASTMVLDDQRAYAMFGDGTLVCFTHAGDLLWSKDLDVSESSYGFASSLDQFNDKLIIQIDRGSGSEEDTAKGMSALWALDKLTGELKWKTVRAAGGTWATPAVIHAANKNMIITSCDPHLIAYDANNGAEIWRADCIGGEIAPSAIFAGNMVIGVYSSRSLAAVKPDGGGDVTQTHVAWKQKFDSPPETASPVSDGQLIFTVNDSCCITCLDLNTGKQIWLQELENLQCQASPTLVGDKLYIVATNGTTIICQAGREYKEIARCRINPQRDEPQEGDEQVSASPAFAPGRIFIRTDKNLYCIDGKGGGK